MDIKQLLIQIDNLKEELLTAPPLNDCELGKMREHFSINYTYNSNAIEGNSLTLRETALVVLEGMTIDQKPLKDHFEAVGHKEAFDYIIDISKKNMLLSERIIKEIHSLVMMAEPKVGGKYRESSVEVLGALDTPPEAVKIPSEMEQWLSDYISDARHPIIKAADYHIKFERIHPFADGNGRTGRLILNLELIKAGYSPVNVKFKDRQMYIECFDDYHLSGNSDKFAKMVAEYELEELEFIRNLMAEKKATQEFYKKENIDNSSIECTFVAGKPRFTTPDDDKQISPGQQKPKEE